MFKKIKNSFFALMAVMMFGFLSIAPVYAENGLITTETVNETVDVPRDGSNGVANNGAVSTQINQDLENNLGIDSGAELVDSIENSDLDINDLGDRLTGKMYEFVMMFQRIMVPISIIAFIVGAILVIWGGASRRASIAPGVITCIAAIAGFLLSQYAPQIVVAVSNWFVS